MRGSKVKQLKKVMEDGLGREPTKSEVRKAKKAVKRIRRYGE
jgi:hypothetical protein